MWPLLSEFFYKRNNMEENPNLDFFIWLIFQTTNIVDMS